MRILSWNIRHGGKSKSGEIVTAVVAHEPDIVLLCEYRASSTNVKLGLQSAGFIFMHESLAPEYKNGLMIASRFPISISAGQFNTVTLSHQGAEIHVLGRDVAILFVHIPAGGSSSKSPQTKLKLEFWNAVIEYANNHADSKALIIGDYNTGFKTDAQGVPFTLANKMDELCDAGWVDAWRKCHPDAQEYTWYCKRRDGGLNGFRLDHAFAAQSLSGSIKRADYSHSERLAGVSDHSMLIVDVAD